MLVYIDELKEIMGKASEEDKAKVMRLIEELSVKHHMTADEYLESAEYKHVLDEAIEEVLCKAMAGITEKIMLSFSAKLAEAISGEALSAEKPNITH